MHFPAEAGRDGIDQRKSQGRRPSLSIVGVGYDRPMTSVASTVAKVMAHRGGRHGGAPNSLDAIAHACDVGALSIEIDVNQTSDGVLISTHDAIIGSDTWLSEYTYDQLLELDRSQWESRRLEDIVSYALSRSTVAYLDLKSIGPEGLKRVAAQWPAEVASHQIIFAAARGDVISWIGDNLDSAATSFLYYDRLLDLSSLAGYMQPTFVHPCFDFLKEPFRTMNERYVDRARSLGFGLVSWSENEPENLARLSDLGFDFICTDEPELAKGVVDSQAG